MPLDTELHKSAHKGDLRGVMDMVESGEIDVNELGAQNRTALHRAAGANHVDIVEYLLEAGAPVNCLDKCLRTPLHWAAISGHLDTAQVLLENGADLNGATVSGMTPLMAAVQQGCQPVVEAILDWALAPGEEEEHLNECDVPSAIDLCAAKDENGKTAFVLAKEKGHRQIVKLLKPHRPKRKPRVFCGRRGKEHQLAAVVEPRRRGSSRGTDDLGASERSRRGQGHQSIRPAVGATPEVKTNDGHRSRVFEFLRQGSWCSRGNWCSRRSWCSRGNWCQGSWCSRGNWCQGSWCKSFPRCCRQAPVSRPDSSVSTETRSRADGATSTSTNPPAGEASAGCTGSDPNRKDSQVRSVRVVARSNGSGASASKRGTGGTMNSSPTSRGSPSGHNGSAGTTLSTNTPSSIRPASPTSNTMIAISPPLDASLRSVAIQGGKQMANRGDVTSIRPTSSTPSAPAGEQAPVAPEAETTGSQPHNATTDEGGATPSACNKDPDGGKEGGRKSRPSLGHFLHRKKSRESTDGDVAKKPRRRRSSGKTGGPPSEEAAERLRRKSRASANGDAVQPPGSSGSRKGKTSFGERSTGGGCSGDNTTPRYLRSDSSASRNLDSSNGARASHGAGLSNESSADRRLAERVGSTLSQEFATSTSDVAVPGDSAGTHGHRDKSGEAFSGSGKLAPDAGFAARSSKKNGRGGSVR